MGNKSSTPPPPPALLEPAMQGNLKQIQAAIEDFEQMIQGPSGAASAPIDRRLADYINQKDAAGNTAMHGAVFAGHLPVVEYLAERGASLEMPNGVGCTPLWLAAGYNRHTVLQFLLKRLPKEALTQPNNTGDSPLLAAASKGHVQICKELLEAAADQGIPKQTLLCHKNRSLDTPLSVAIAAGFGDELFDFLYDDSIINHANQKGLTALLVACERDWSVLVKRMVEKGAKLDVLDANGDTVLGVAAFCGSAEVLQYLVEGFAQMLLNRQNETTGCTPLWLATRAGHLKCARELLTAGADASLENADGLTPLQAAEKFQRPDFVQLLKGHEEAKKSAQ